MCKVIRVLDKNVIARRLNATLNHDAAIGARKLRVWARRTLDMSPRTLNKMTVDQLAELYAVSK